MITTIGLAIILGCGLSLVVLLFRLRDCVCPQCKATGSLMTIELLREEQPELGIIATIRTRRCGDCGAIVSDRRLQPMNVKPSRRRNRQRAVWRLRHLPRPLPIPVRSFPADR